jgi:hypothetical protein
MQTRRRFIQALSVSGLVLAGAEGDARRLSRRPTTAAPHTASHSVTAGNSGPIPVAQHSLLSRWTKRRYGRRFRYPIPGKLSAGRRNM